MTERFLKIDGHNTYHEWHLIMESMSIEMPEPKTHTVELDGTDGALDLSEALAGRMTYKDRALSFTFITDYGTRDDRTLILDAIARTVHGKRVRLIEPDHPYMYLDARLRLADKANTNAYASLKITGTASPYYTANEDISHDIVLAGEEMNVAITNGGSKQVLPLLTVTGSVTIASNGKTTSLSDGKYTVSDIRLNPGANIFTVNGNGTIKFTWREGYL